MRRYPGMNYYERQAARKANAAANAAKKAAREAAAMTCQCCGGNFLANTGRVAHHGYQRPGWGWQTASCIGARELPFEVSREALGRHIKGLEEWKAGAIENGIAVKEERVGISLTFPDYSAPRVYGKRPTKTIVVTRADFDAAKAEHAFRNLGWNDFDTVKERDLDRRRAEVRNVSEEIKRQHARFDGWKQTHQWDKATKSWIKI